MDVFEAVTNGIVIFGVVVVVAVITAGALITPRPSGAVTGTAARFGSLSGWRLLGVAAISWSMLAALTILLWIPIPVALSPAASTIARILGLVLFDAGVGLILWGRRTLGPLWTVTTTRGVQLHREHQLIRRGPFGIVRHPMYLGIWLFLGGSLLIYRTWPLAGYLLFSVPRFLGRARIEERALAGAFGQQWVDYASRVPMLIPRWIGRIGDSASRRGRA